MPYLLAILPGILPGEGLAATGVFPRVQFGQQDIRWSSYTKTGDILLLSDGAFYLLSATNGQVLRTMREGDFNAAAVSPEGSKLLLGDGRTAKLYDIPTWTLLWTFDEPGITLWGVQAVAFSPSGKEIAVGRDAACFLVDSQTGQRLKTYSGHNDLVWSVAFSPDGTRLAVGSQDVKLWNLTTGEQLWKMGELSLGRYRVAFSRDGSRLFAQKYQATVLDASDGRVLRSFVSDYHSLPFSELGPALLLPDGETVIIIVSEFRAAPMLYAWNIATGLVQPASVSRLTVEGADLKVTSLAVSPDGSQLFAASTGTYKAQAYNLATGALLWRAFPGHLRGVTSVAFSPAGGEVLTGSDDGTAMLWDTSTGSLLRTFGRNTGGGGFGDEPRAIKCVAFSPNGAHVLTLSSVATLWNASSGALVRVFGDEQMQFSSAAAFAPNGAAVVTSHGMGGPAGGEKLLRSWDVSSGALLKIYSGHSDVITSVAYSPDGANLATGSEDGTARLWDARTGSLLRSFKGLSRAVGMSWKVTSVAFSPQGTEILAGGSWGVAGAVLWDAQTGRTLRTFEDPNYGYRVSSVAFSPDGLAVMTAGTGSPGEPAAKLWDAAAGVLLETYHNQANKLITSAAVSTDGKSLVAGRSDGTALLWSVGKQERGQLRVTLRPPEVIRAGAQWRMSGETGEWKDSGDTVTVPISRTYTLTFKIIAGWKTPTNQDLVVTDPRTYEAEATYVKNDFDFEYWIENDQVFITGYLGPGGLAAIPASIEGLPVTTIGAQAFSGCTILTNVTIPNSVTRILFAAFQDCTSLLSVTIPGSVTNISSYAFRGCTSLAGLYFQGNAPKVEDKDAFRGVTATIFYLPTTSGWDSTFSDLATALWQPALVSGEPDFGLRHGRFGFNIQWSTAKVVIIEASSSPANPIWIPIGTNVLNADGVAYFSDPDWTSYRSRIYRIYGP